MHAPPLKTFIKEKRTSDTTFSKLPKKLYRLMYTQAEVLIFLHRNSPTRLDNSQKAFKLSIVVLKETNPSKASGPDQIAALQTVNTSTNTRKTQFQPTIDTYNHDLARHVTCVFHRESQSADEQDPSNQPTTVYRQMHHKLPSRKTILRLSWKKIQIPQVQTRSSTGKCIITSHLQNVH